MIKEEKKGECAHCKTPINLQTVAQTSCQKCQKDFCCALSSTCFTDYHRINNTLNCEHKHNTILNPGYLVNLRPRIENEMKYDLENLNKIFEDHAIEADRNKCSFNLAKALKCIVDEIIEIKRVMGNRI